MDWKGIFPENGGTLTGAQGAVLAILVIWSLIWKGLALWKAARRGDTAWYVVLLILNTLGILEIIYYFAVGRGAKSEKSE